MSSKRRSPVATACPDAIAVSSGTSALEIIFRALDVKDREVVIPTNTFFATAAAAVHAGGIPRLADISPDTLALSPETLEAALTPETAFVVLVHIGGLITPEIDAIADICDRRGIVLIEDAAHAHGASFEGRPAGSFGRAAAFSFYPTKVMTSGEGGMITTADERLRDEAIIYRDQGKAGFLGGDHVRMGYAWRMSELHAAVGLIHLSHLDEAIATRRRVAARYDEALAGLPGCQPLSIPDGLDLQLLQVRGPSRPRYRPGRAQTRALRATGSHFRVRSMPRRSIVSRSLPTWAAIRSRWRTTSALVTSVSRCTRT